MKTLTKKISIFVILTLSTLNLIAQKQQCSFDKMHKEYFEDHPRELKKTLEFNKKIKEQKTSNNNTSAKTTGTTIIPVVFHIYDAKYPNDQETGESRSVTDERVIKALADINANFKGFNDAVDQQYSNIEGGMNIEFRLAQIDPDGNTTTGIIYHERKGGFGLLNKDAEIASYAWDNYKYMNVHIQEVVNSTSILDSGIAWFPIEDQSNRGIARVVYNGRFILYDPPASSLTHEFGHWLGLYHTFEGGCVRDNTDNTVGDRVADTAPTTRAAATLPGSVCDQAGVRNCFNEVINHSNHMDYNPCENMFTKGQVNRMTGFLDHPARKPLWQDANLVATGTKNDLGPRIIFNYQISTDPVENFAVGFLENFNTNNGNIFNKKRIKTTGGAKFTLSSGNMQQGVHFNATGVPSGLTPVITVQNNENATISFTGNATNHAEANSTEIQITFLNNAIVGGVNSLYSATAKYKVDFNDAYQNIYETYSPFLIGGRSVPEALDATPSKFNSLVIGGNFRTRLTSYDGNTITIDNDGKEFEVLCLPNTKNVIHFNEGSTISSSSSGTWLGSQGANTSPLIIYSPSYTSFRGRTSYAAIRVPTITGEYLYGWLKIRISSDGFYAELMSFGLNPDPGKSIRTIIDRPHLVYSRDRFLESIDNNGAMKNEITVDLKNTSLVKSGTLTPGVDFSASNVPNGLTLNARVINSTQIKLTMNGVAVNHDWVQTPAGFVKDIQLTFSENIFANNQGSNVEFRRYPLNVEYVGGIITQKLDSPALFDVGGAQFFGGFMAVGNYLANLEQAGWGYQFVDYTANNNAHPGVKLENFNLDIATNNNFEVTFIQQRSIIGPNTNWTHGREWNEGRGQPMIDSDTYRAWRGRTGFVGIRYNRSGKMHYGWLEMRVASNGRRFEFLSYALNGTPEASIRAGETTSNDIKEYCDAKGLNGTEAITGVEFAGIKNSSARNSSGYVDNTGQVGYIAKGKSYPLKVNFTGWNNGANARIYAWIDWNNDKDFTDSGEFLTLTKNNQTAEISVNVPTNATLGITRMRIRVDDRTSNAPCGDRSRGEVEDYQVKIGISNASCSDGVQNGDETGIDCGGSSCNDCEETPTCEDGIKNNGETEVDCGGEFCAPCEVFTEHCEARQKPSNETDFVEITNVTFRTINQSSTANTEYTDYPNVSTTHAPGDQVSLAVTLKNTFPRTTVGVWIDWNNDNDFRDDNERVMYILNKALGSGSYNATVTIPSSSVRNTSLRMRVRSSYSQDLLLPCGISTYSGEVEDYRIIVTGTASTVAAPTNLSFSNTTQNGVTLNWNASSTNNVKYNVYQNNGNQPIARNLTTTNYNVTGLAAGTTYTFFARAINSSNIESTNSNTVTVTTESGSVDPTYCNAGYRGGNYISEVRFGDIINSDTDNRAYSDFTNLSTNVQKGQSLNLTVNPDPRLTNWTSNVVAAWIDWNRNGTFEDSERVLTKTAGIGGQTSSVQVPNNAEQGRTRLRVRYQWATVPSPCGTSSSDGYEVEDYTVIIDSDSTPVDTEKPTAPTLTFNNVTQTSVTLNWSGATDNIGIARYEVYQNNNTNSIANITGNSYTVTSLTAESTHIFYIKAFDAANNDSPNSNIISVTTLPNPSTVEGGTVSTSNNQTQITTVTGDGVPDLITFSNSNSSGANYRYLITDANNNILETETNSHDFEGAAIGICRVYGIAYEGTLNAVGKNITNTTLASGNFDVSSNSITIDRVAPPSEGNVVYVNMADVTISSTRDWSPFQMEIGDGDTRFYPWFNGSELKMLYSTNKPLVTNGSTANVTFINEGTTIGTSNNYRTENQLNLSSNSYTDWRGKSGYIGFNFKVNGTTHYGWLYASISTDGKSVTFLDYAYNSEAGKSLIAKRPVSAKTINNTEKVLTKINLFPNPFKNDLIIDVSALGNNLNISIYDTLGKEIINKNYIENPLQIIINKEITSPGNYIVKIQTNEKLETFNVIKLK